MIEAARSALFDRVFRVYNRGLLRKHFAAVRVGGLDHLGSLDRSQPIICYGNHSCWWDGLIEYFLAYKVVDADVFLMMEEKQLQRYRFFRRVGAFSVDRSSPRDALRSVRYAARLFDRPNRILWIYPQGGMMPNDTRPLHFHRGAATIAALAGKPVQCVPVVHRYEFLLHQRPDAFVLIGEPITAQPPVDNRRLTEELQSTATSLLDKLRMDISCDTLDEYRTILQGAISTNERYDRFRGRA
jgi:chlorobactene lauroyltransferase